MSTDPSKNEDSILKDALVNSGFQSVPIKELYNTLDKMEQYMIQKTGVSKEDLDSYLEEVKNLVGEEESMKLHIDEIVSWIKAFRS